MKTRLFLILALLGLATSSVEAARFYQPIVVKKRTGLKADTEMRRTSHIRPGTDLDPLRTMHQRSLKKSGLRPWRDYQSFRGGQRGYHNPLAGSRNGSAFRSLSSSAQPRPVIYR